MGFYPVPFSYTNLFSRTNAVQSDQAGKSEEEIIESTLLDVDEAFYVSREKGGLALYAIAQQHGVDRFNRWFNRWLNKWLMESSQKEEGLFVFSHEASPPPFNKIGHITVSINAITRGLQDIFNGRDLCNCVLSGLDFLGADP